MIKVKQTMEQQNVTSRLTFYSQRAIGIATFIGGPLAAGYLIRENYLALEQPNQGKKALIIGIIATIILFGGIFMVPESVISKIPNQIIPLVYTGIIYLIVNRIHGEILNNHKTLGNAFYSIWKSVGIGFISLFLILIGVFGYIFLSPEGEEYEIYDNEMTKFSQNESESLVFYNNLDTKSSVLLIKELDAITIPKWKENIEIIKKINAMDSSPLEYKEQNMVLLKYSELRLKAFKLFRKAIAEDTEKYYPELQQIHNEIETQLDFLEKM